MPISLQILTMWY